MNEENLDYSQDEYGIEVPKKKMGNFGKIEKITKYGTEVWADVEMDELRRDRCLCFNCGEKDNDCSIAKRLYDICQEENMAISITRCKNYTKPSLPKVIFL